MTLHASSGFTAHAPLPAHHEAGIARARTAPRTHRSPHTAPSAASGDAEGRSPARGAGRGVTGGAGARRQARGQDLEQLARKGSKNPKNNPVRLATLPPLLRRPDNARRDSAHPPRRLRDGTYLP